MPAAHASIIQISIVFVDVIPAKFNVTRMPGLFQCKYFNYACF